MERPLVGRFGQAAAGRHALLAWPLVVALAIAGCAGQAVTASAPPGSATPGAPTPSLAAAPSPDAPDPATAADVLAFAESLAPPGGVERGRTTNDGAVLLRWISTDTMETLDAHYQRVVAEGGFDVVRTSSGPLLTFIFTSTPAVPAAGSIQVTVAPGEGHLVSVTAGPAS